MANTDDDEDNVRSDGVDNASVPSTTHTDISQPMVLTAHYDMFQGFVEALLIPPDDTNSFNSHGMRPPVQTITVNAPNIFRHHDVTGLIIRKEHIYRSRRVCRELSLSLT